MNKVYMSLCLLASMITVSMQASLLSIYHVAGFAQLKEQSLGVTGYTLTSRGGACPLDTKTVTVSLPQSSIYAGKKVTHIRTHDSTGFCTYTSMKYNLSNGETKEITLSGKAPNIREVVVITDTGDAFYIENPF